MRHLTISSYGVFLGTSGSRLVVTEKDGSVWETPLSRLRSIKIEKPGISLSGALILACASRGIRLFFVDWKNTAVAAVSGRNQHAVVKVRQSQFDFIRTNKASDVAAEMIRTKIRNQRAVLLYFGKYLSRSDPQKYTVLRQASEVLDEQSKALSRLTSEVSKEEKWRELIMGVEGFCAKIYWKALGETGLLGETFIRRLGRGAVEPTNAALNYGYAILSSYAWSALDNAGLELYAGILHTNRPGKPSLILDFMEEYRPWVVDRNIIKLRHKFKEKLEFMSQEIKKSIVDSLDETMSSKILWKGKKISLENIMQRQAYRLAGTFVDNKRYTGLKFKW